MSSPRFSAGGVTRLSPGGTNLFGTTTAYNPRPATVRAASPVFTPNTIAAQALVASQAQKNAERNRKAREKRALNKGTGVGRGSRKRSLAERLASAKAKGKVIDVSDFENVKLINSPTQMRSKFGVLTSHFAARGAPAIAIVSNNVQNYIKALNELGHSNVDVYADAWERVAGGEGRPKGAPRGPRGPAKSAEQLAAAKRESAKVSRARAKVKKGAALTNEDQLALAQSEARREAREAQSAANKLQKARAKILGGKAGVLSPKSRAAFSTRLPSV